MKNRQFSFVSRIFEIADSDPIEPKPLCPIPFLLLYYGPQRAKVFLRIRRPAEYAIRSAFCLPFIISYILLHLPEAIGSALGPLQYIPIVK